MNAHETQDLYDLQRFLKAQEEVYPQALAEIQGGHKDTHWIWFIFPQLAGLSSSYRGRRYALVSMEEARAYLEHPVLGVRLKEITQALLALDGWQVQDIFGDPDYRKVHSSLTLFAELSEPGSIFHQALEKYYNCEKNQPTLERMTSLQAEVDSHLNTSLVEQNLITLEELFANGGIRLERGSLFDFDLPPISQEVSFDRIEGMLLGLAIGDALGITTESMTPGSRRSQYGEIRDYLPNKYTGRQRGYPSDDSQLAFWTLDQLNNDHGLDPQAMAIRLAQGILFGIGATVRSFQSFIKGGTPWYQAGPHSAGNGALMRIAPLLIPHLRTGGKGLWADTALASMLTHNDPASTAACLAFIAILWELLEMDSPPEPSFWLSRYVQIARELEGDSQYRARGGFFTEYEGTIWNYTEERITFALKHDRSTLEACSSWYSGAYLMETMPSVIYILTRHGHNPEEAIIRAVNDTKDNDTIAAIVGAAVGALHGKDALPDRWLDNLTGRTTDADDGMMYEILGRARRIFWD